ncbi:hypothetical protein [Streptomyces sp. Tu 3180]|uniref:hypothetical protein n=1 Tax=Streptomyces sp. Tu 3180 TaxID=2682611 RepID=UPI00135BD731|nr:hypothetical protein [Streptomyces sp. Tu 3180]KAF3463387.1 hypothetical protein GL259_02935 [Streptomyces sp. Tu 3180]
MQATSTTVTAGSRSMTSPTAGALAVLLGLRAGLTVDALLQTVPVVLPLVSPVHALQTMLTPPDTGAVPPAREGTP